MTPAPADFDVRIGLDRLVMVHLNDSKSELGSRLDRHEHLPHREASLHEEHLAVIATRFDADHFIDAGIERPIAGTEGCATIATAKAESIDTPRRSFSVSYGISRRSTGLMV